MSVATEHYLHGVSLAGTFISQLQSANVAMNNEILVKNVGGDHRPFFTALMGQRPAIEFVTGQIATTLGVIGQYGADLSGGNCDLLFRKATDLGTREAAASSAHQRWRSAQTWGMWSQISAQFQQEATISVGLTPTWNGSVDPVVYAGEVALSGTPAPDELFTLGSLSINGTVLDGVQEVTLASGVVPSIRGAGDNMWPTFAGTKMVQAVFTIRTLELPQTWALGTKGAALSSTGVVWYLRKKTRDGHIASGTASHIKISGTTGCVYPIDASGSISEEATAGLLVYVLAPDVSSNPLTIATASAIT